MTLRRAMSAIIPMIYFSILAGSPPMAIAQERTEPEARTYLLETVDFKIIIYNPTKPCFKKIWFGAGCVGNQVGMLLIARVSGPLVLADTDRTIDACNHLSSCNYVKRPKEKRERCVRSRYACTPKREKGGRAPP